MNITPGIANRLIHGDCVAVLPTLDAESIDACVTDPPYALTAMSKRWAHTNASDRQPGAPPYSRHSAGFMGKAWDSPLIVFDPATWAEVLRVLKPGAQLLAFGGTRTYHRLVCAIEDAGFEIRDTITWLYGSGFPKSKNLSVEWDGWGTALKPSAELIVLARKPLSERNVAANVLRWGTGALNIDASRIDSEQRPVMVRTSTVVGARAMAGRSTGARPNGETTGLGRWPANVVLDEDAAGDLDEASGERPSGKMHSFHRNGPQRAVYGQDALAGYMVSETYGDSGGASRFFYTAKADGTERNVNQAKRNSHPTVKPLTLMSWLVRLVTPPRGVVLDPFLGSGTTAIACIGNGFGWVGIEREAEYIATAEQRIGLGCVAEPAVSITPAAVEVRVRLPRGLGVSPNERVHWAERSRRNADVRAAAKMAAILACGYPKPELDHVTIQFEVVWPKGARRRDSDNCMAMLKPCLDGIVDGKVILSDAPDHCTLLPPVQSRDKRAVIPVVIARIRRKA